MSGKKKNKHHQPPSASDLIRIAGEKLERGQARDAIESLRSAEAKFKQSAASSKKTSVPPHIIAAQAALPQLLARALYSRSLTVDNPVQRVADLDEAVKYAPEDFRYRLARGLCRLLIGDTQAAQIDFQKADQIQSRNELVNHAIFLGELATQNGRGAREFLDRSPTEKRNANWQRMPNPAENIGGRYLQASGSERRLSLLEGMLLLERGDHEAALERLSNWPPFERNPSDAEAAIMATQLFYSGALKFMAERYQAARDSFDEAQRLASSHHVWLPWMASIDAYCHQIAEKVAANNLQLAAQCWQTILKGSPDDETARANLAIANRAAAHRLWSEGDANGAVALWQEALQSDPQNESLLKSLGLGFEKLGRKPDGSRHWRALARIWRQQLKQRSAEPGFKDRLLRLEQHVVELMIETGEPENEIITELEAALKLDPENLDLRWQTAERMMEIERPQQALRHIEIVERRRGASSELLTRKASALASLRRFTEAGKTLERAIELDPSNTLARRGQILLMDEEAEHADENGHLGRAIEIRRKQLAIDPTHVPAMFHLSSLHFDLDQDKEALECLKRAVAVDPDNLRLRLDVGEAYLESGYLKEAEEEFERAIALNPDFETLHDIAMFYLDEDEVKKSIKYFDRAAEVADADQLIDLATHMFDANRGKDANRYLAKAKKLDHTHPIPYVIKALIELSDPIAALLGVENSDQMRKDLDFAETLALKYPEHAKKLDLIRELKQRLESSLE